MSLIINRFQLDKLAAFVTVQYTVTDEVYGWFEHNGHVIRDSGGWWRTTDPKEALRLAELIALRDNIIDKPVQTKTERK